jgi:hypothetical protein
VPLTVSRMNAYRLVLAAAALTIAITSALVAALVSFSGQALSQVAHRQLASAPGTAITVSGQAGASQAAADTAGIRAQLRSAFGASGFVLYQAQWSELLKLPGHYGGSGTPVTEAVAVPGIGAHAVLVTGSWPGPPVAGRPVPAALPAAAAALLHLSAGDVVTVRQQVSGQVVRLDVTGLFRPAGRTAAFWNLDLVGASGASSSDGFTTYGPLLVNRAALTSALSVSQGSWVAVPATGNIPAGAMATLAGKLGAATQAVANLGSSGGLQVTTVLPGLLSGIARNLLVARSLLVVAGLLLLLLAGFALTSVARLLATDREGESALLTSRGGSRWQLTRLTVPEVALLAAAAAAAGCVAGGWLAIWLSRTGPLRFADLRLRVVTGDAAGGVVVTAAFAALILLGPVLRTLTPGAARVRRGRQAAIAGMARSGADLALVVLAGLAIWQLHDSLIVAPSANGTTGIDPVLALAPALAVGAGTVILVRLLPLLAKLFDRLASRGARLPLSLASWQVSRHPVRQASVALLVVMSVATGTLALSEHQSWARSAQDQASFSAGAQVRVDTAAGVSPAQAGAIASAPGVTHAMAAAPISSGGAEVLAIDARQAASVVLIRRDQTRLAPAALFGAITPSGRAAGVALPGRPAGVSLTLSLGPASLRLVPASVTVTVAGSEGVIAQLPAGTLAGDGKSHVLRASFGRLPAAAYPLRLTAVTLGYTLPYTRPGSGASLRVLRLAESGAGWASPGTVLGGWAHSVSSGQLAGIVSTNAGLMGGSATPSAGSWQAAGAGVQTFSFGTGFGLGVPGATGQPPAPIGAQIALIAKPAGPLPLPAIVTQPFAKANSIGVGSIAQARLDGLTVPVRVVAEVAAFPTVAAASGAIIVDLAALQDYLAGQSVTPLPVTEWWLAGGKPDLTGRLPAGSSVTTSAGVAAGLLGDALSAVPQQALLATAVAAALLAITGFCVSITANVSQRRSQSALLSALGVAPAAQARQLCLEELIISLPAAAVGLILGALVSALFVPATTLTADATRPFPPVIIEIPWALAVPLALAVAALPVLVAALSAARRPDPAGTLRTAESA